MGETDLFPDSGSPEWAGMGWGILEGNGNQGWETPDSAGEFKEGFLEERMFELCCEGPVGANKAEGRKRVQGRGLCVEDSKVK